MPTLWDRLNGALGAFWPLQPTRSRGRPYRPPAQRREHVGEALSRWATRTVEKIRSHAFAGQLRFLPWLDHYTDETHEIRAEYPKMMRDGTIKAGFLTKVLAVCQLPLQVHPVDADHPRDQHCAELVKHAYETIGITEKNGRRRPASAWAGTVGCAWSILAGGVMRGHSVNELIWEEDVIQRGKFRGKRRWRALKSKDTNYLQLSVDQYRNITAIRGTAYNAGKVFNPEDFVIYTYLPFFESPVGTSDFRAAYRHYWYKDTLLKIQSLHLEKYTGPFLQGTYGTPAQKAALEQAFENARGGGWITIPTGALVEATSLAVSGTTDFEGAIRYHDQQMLIALVGAHLQILEGQVTNNRGDTREHRQTSELFQWLLAETLTGIYKTQMVPDLVAENYHDVEPPNITLGAVSEKELEARARLNDMLQKQGFKLSKKEEYSYFGRSEPTDPDDILEPPGAGGPPGGDDGGAGGLAGLLGGGGGGNGQAGEPEEEEPEAEAEPFAEGEPCKKGEAASKTGCTPAGGKSGQKLTRQERNQQGRAAGTTRAQQEAWQARQAAGDHPLARPAANVLGNVYESAAGIGSQQEARLILDPKRAAARVKADVEQEATRALAPVREWTQDRFGRQAGTVNRRLAALVRELASTTANGTRGSLAFAQEHVRYGKPAMREKLREALQEEANPATAASRFEDVFGTPDDPGALMDVLGDDLAGWPVDLAALAERGKPAADLAAALQKATGTSLEPRPDEDGWDYWERADEAVLDPLRQQAVQELYEQVRARLLPRGTATLSEDEHDWAAMSEADWQAFAAADWQPYRLSRGPNKGKQVWKHRTSGKISHDDPKVKEKEAREKEKAKATAAKAKEKERLAKAKEKERQRKAAEKEAAKAGEKKTKALSSLREITAGRQKPTPARVREIGAVLVTLKADELKALKAELGVKGGSTKAAMIEKIQEKALAKPEGKAAKPTAKPARAKVDPKRQAKDLPAEAKRLGLDSDQVALLELSSSLERDFQDGSTVSIPELRKRAAAMGIKGQAFDDAMKGLAEKEFLDVHRHVTPAHLTPQERKELLHDPDTDSYFIGAALRPDRADSAKKIVQGTAAGESSAATGPPQSPEPGFTGTDSLGREWVNGKLVAAREKPKAARSAAAAKPARAKPEPPGDPAALARETAELYGRASAPEVTPERIDALGERLAGLSKEQLVNVAAEVDLKGVEGKSKAAIIQEVTDRIRFRKGASQKTKAIGRIPGGQPQVSRPDDWENPPDPDYVPITEPSRPRTVKPPKPEPTGIARETRDLYERMADPSVTPADIDRMMDRLRGASKADVVAAAEAMDMLGMGAKSKEAVLEAIKDRMTYRKGMAIKVSNITPYGVDPREHRGSQPPEPGFTGTDSLGREWVNGKLVAAREKPKAARSAAAPKAAPTPSAPAAPTPLTPAHVQEFEDALGAASVLSGGNWDAHEPGQTDALRRQLIKQTKQDISPEQMNGIVTELIRENVLRPFITNEARAVAEDSQWNPSALRVGGKLYGHVGLVKGQEERLREVLGEIASGQRPVQPVQGGNEINHPADLIKKDRSNPQPPEPRFTGTDSLGREWRDGKLVAKREEPKAARPAAAKPAAPPTPAPAAAPASVAPPPVAYRPLNQPGMPGDGARIPVYDRDDLDPDFSLPDEPALMRATLAAAEKVARENYSVVLTSNLYEEVRKTRPDLTANDFLTQLVAWQKRGIISLGVVNDPHLIPREDLEKMPMVRQWSAQVAGSDERLRGFFNPTVSAEAKALAAQAR